MNVTVHHGHELTNGNTKTMTAHKTTDGSGKMWGGRFTESTAASVEAFTASIHFDCRLYKYDIAGSCAHAKMLARQGLISEQDRDLILAGLAEIETEIDEGRFAFRQDLEDIHMNIEKSLAARTGPAGERLHTARSRNDQVALDLRLYLRDQCDRLDLLLKGLRQAFVRLARRHFGIIMPGYTHLQRAQPVLVAHHLLAYDAMFKRDQQRLADCRQRINVMPLGSAALAGTGLPIDREFVARELGFPTISTNSMDTVGDRDFALEFVSACTITQLHLSRLAEELVLWATAEFDFIAIADSYCTGSSIMPQKKNPDIPELIRGKTGRVAGNLMALITMLKGLPLTYNRDLQEDKEPVFDTVDTVGSCLSLAAEILTNLHFKEDRLQAAAAGGGCMTATDIADYLVRKDVPFRQAHSIVGQIVTYSLDHGKKLPELSIAELQDFSPAIEDDIYRLLTVEGSVASRTSAGGTAQSAVEKALQIVERELGITPAS